MLDNIKIPDDINTIIIYVDIVILISILGYSYVASINSMFTKPLALVFASIGSIFVCLCIKGYQRSVKLEFERENTHLRIGDRKLKYLKDGYEEKEHNVQIISLVFFILLYTIAIVLQGF